jgi:N-acetylmuramoyl-L-alanine amidase
MARTVSWGRSRGRGPAAVVAALLFLWILGVTAASAETVQTIRYSSNGERTRVVLDLDQVPDFSHRPLPDPPRVVVELPQGRLAAGIQPFSIGDGYVRGVRINELRSGRVQIVLDLERALSYKVVVLANPHRLVVDVEHSGPPAPIAEPPREEPARDPSPKRDSDAGRTASPKTEIAPDSRTGSVATSPPAETRPSTPITPEPPRKGPWRIAVDAGHGGQDHGARYFGTSEKDITLKLARELVAELNTRKGVEAFMVRKGDYFIPLYQRRAIAEKDSADLFVSLHCNASTRSAAAGTEVFFLSLKGASDEAARELAELENMVDEKMGVAPEPEGLDTILFDMRQTDVLAKSEFLAETCLNQLFALGTVYNRGVKQAGFAVLKSPRIPSVLVEAAVVSNRDEHRLLKSGKWQREFGKCMADGIEAYCKNVQRAEHIEPE